MKLLQEMLCLLVFLKKAHTKKKLNKIMTASIGKNNSTKMLFFFSGMFSLVPCLHMAFFVATKSEPL